MQTSILAQSTADESNAGTIDGNGKGQHYPAGFIKRLC
jgi:hypothetical protein